tara:strand:+ start:693 stop:824 length:132 start_codon:yes stop_codon:yes gene_type:complete
MNELTLIERLTTAFFHFFLIICFFCALWIEAERQEKEERKINK